MKHLIGTKVRVYRNLTRRTLSVQTFVPGKGWRLSYHANLVTLANASFEVSLAGRRRVLATKRKNVHAFVVGTLAAPFPALTGTRVSYNPYKGSSFTDPDGAPVAAASLATVTTGGIIAA